MSTKNKASSWSSPLGSWICTKTFRNQKSWAWKSSNMCQAHCHIAGLEAEISTTKWVSFCVLSRFCRHLQDLGKANIFSTEEHIEGLSPKYAEIMNMLDAVSDWEHVSNTLKHLGQAPPPPSSAPSTAARALFAVTTLCAGVWLEVLKHLRQTGLWFALGQISNYVGLQRVWPRPLMRWRDNWFIQAKKHNDKRCPHFNQWLCLGYAILRQSW